jgi:hypothetical protein
MLPSVEKYGSPVRVELLFFDGCPAHEHVRDDLAEVIAELKIEAHMSFVKVTTQAQADALHFAGSPTVQVNGRDLEDYDGPGILGCRLYGENRKGWPKRELLKQRLSAAMALPIRYAERSEGSRGD